jgi:hypothetical protein
VLAREDSSKWALNVSHAILTVQLVSTQLISIVLYVTPRPIFSEVASALALAPMATKRTSSTTCATSIPIS